MYGLCLDWKLMAKQCCINSFFIQTESLLIHSYLWSFMNYLWMMQTATANQKQCLFFQLFDPLDREMNKWTGYNNSFSFLHYLLFFLLQTNISVPIEWSIWIFYSNKLITFGKSIYNCIPPPLTKSMSCLI